mgnify:CR=1 FL=1
MWKPKPIYCKMHPRFKDKEIALEATWEAGCLFTDWKGNPWDGKGNHLLFARPEVHGKLVELIHDIQ